MYVPDYVHTLFVTIISHVDQSKGYRSEYIAFIKIKKVQKSEPVRSFLFTLNLFSGKMTIEACLICQECELKTGQSNW